jgi:carboxypeptidase C (cathepsin A)
MSMVRDAMRRQPRRTAVAIRRAWGAAVAVLALSAAIVVPATAGERGARDAAADRPAGADLANHIGHAAFFAPLVTGDEPIVVTRHRIRTASGVLEYEARAGRLPIRNDESGEVRGRAFFVAYVATSRGGAARPLTFIWNGGPTAPAVLLHSEMFGPRRLQGGSLVDNPETLLATSDLVFFDPVGTGFSRPETAASEAEFLGVLGDQAAAAEFIRAWRVKFAAEAQPLFIAGESYGTWRASGVAELLAKRGIPLRAAILISGGIPGMGMPDAFVDALYVPARTASAFHHGKLAPDLMRDRAATLESAAEWARTTYRSALENVAGLDDARREAIAAELARYTGIPASAVDRKSLFVSNVEFRKLLFGNAAGRTLNTFDMRRFDPLPEDENGNAAFTRYLRRELGYATDLAYTPLESGYMPAPGPERQSTGSRWRYDHREITPEMMERTKRGGGPPGSLPWLQNAMRLNRGLRVFVAAGRFDSLNSCAGNPWMVATLEPDLASRFTLRCYEGGHMMYRDEAERLRLSKDVAEFVRSTSVAR